MTFDYMENLAREYNAALRNSGESTESLISSAEEIIERQLAIINTLLFCGRESETLSYLESLKQTSLRDLRALLGDTNDVPSVAGRLRQSDRRAVASRLVNLQIELFTILDLLKKKGSEVDTVISRENRAMAFIAALI